MIHCMIKKYSKAGLLLGAAAISCLLAIPAMAQPGSDERGPGVAGDKTAMAPYVTQSMCTPEFWSARYRGADEVLLTGDQIAALNDRIMQTPETNMFDLAALPELFNGRELADKMADFSSPENLYLNGEPIPESYYQAIRDKIKGAAVSEQMPLRYGFAVNHTVMKGYPYSEFWSDSLDDNEWDNLAASSIYVNEPLAIYYVTADGQFAYVKSNFCSGWVPVADIAICKDKTEWEEARTMEHKIIVTGEKVYLEASALSPQASEKRLAMGTELEWVPEGETSIAGRYSWNNYVVKLPCRDANGMFCQELALIPANRDVSTKYLSFTSENILEQAFKLLGNRYGWGGMLYAQDCSGYVRDIYRCFGLVLPRNTTWQAAMPVEVELLDEMTDEQKDAELTGLIPGTILQFRGHEMIYLGKYDGKHFTINDVSTLVASDDVSDPASVLRVRSVIVNDLTTRRRNGHTWFQDLNKIIKVYNPQM